jgi:hypothetical protein
VANDEPSPTRLERLLGSAASVVAPLSVLSALLFYFGYASSRAQYEYFGVDVDTVGLSTQDYVMRSPQPLLTPLLVLVLLGVALGRAHEYLRDRGRHLDRVAGGAVRAGAAGLVAGVALLALYTWLRDWPPYPLLVPIVLAAGAGLLLYGRRVRRSLVPAEPARPGVAALCGVVLAASLFWATATLAEWSGRGAARDLALHPERLPSVILDTKERLYVNWPHVAERALPVVQGQTFRYRYRDLRLLIQGRDRLFLVPVPWSASNTTIVVPMSDGSMRLQFQFQNLAPE